MKNVMNHLVKRVKSEQFIWCLTAVALCWANVSDYHKINYVKQLLIASGISFYYAYVFGAFRKKHLLRSGILAALGIGITFYLCHVNYFSDCHYYNYAIGILVTVCLIQYAALFTDWYEKRQLPEIRIVSLAVLLTLFLPQISINGMKGELIPVFFVFAPLALMQMNGQRQQNIFKGLVDGICVGSIITMGYAYLFRPYNAADIRYIGFVAQCSLAGQIFMLYATAWFVKYALMSRMHDRRRYRWVAWVLGAYMLATTYLTGCRGPVLGLIMVVAVLEAWLCHSDRSVFKNIRKWFVKCVCIGLISVMLFPVAFCAARYIPTLLNKPDSLDSVGNRKYSAGTLLLNRGSLRDFEYGWNYVQEGDAADSIKYATFPESVLGTFGRIVPGAYSVLAKIWGDEVSRIETQRKLYFFPSEETVSQVTDADEQSDEKEKESTDVAEETAIKRPIAAEKALQVSEEYVLRKVRGESPEYPLFDYYDGTSSMALRNRLHYYAFRNLNFVGHPQGSFKCYASPTYELVHAHNMFLITGYNFGVLSMIAMLAVFIGTIGISAVLLFWKKTEIFLVPLCITIAMIIFGWYESITIFGNDTIYFVYICAICIPNSIILKRKVSGKLQHKS